MRHLWQKAIIVIAVGYGAAMSKIEVMARSAHEHAMARIKVVPPDTTPSPSQASIDLAMVMFGITVPSSAQPPVFSPGLIDRGATLRGIFMEKAVVSIGPAAFSSWALLGSTLAHELEIHCRQSFLIISVMGKGGLKSAERQAYTHELRNARRFGLSRSEIDLITETMDHYYPGKSGAVTSWLASPFASEGSTP